MFAFHSDSRADSRTGGGLGISEFADKFSKDFYRE